MLYEVITYCTVSFVTNGANSIPNQTAGKLSSLDLPDDPQKSGFYFGGWYKDSGLTDYFDSSSDRVYSDMTLYVITSYSIHYTKLYDALYRWYCWVDIMHESTRKTSFALLMVV